MGFRLPPFALSVAVLVQCVGTGPVNASAGVPSAHGRLDASHVSTLDHLAERLARCDPSSVACPHVVYVRSPSMPLSSLGVREIVGATRALGVPLTVLPESAIHALPADLDGPASDPVVADLRSGLVRAGATVHFPAVVVFEGLRPRGSAIVGFKREAAYRALLRLRLDGYGRTEGTQPAPLGPPRAAPSKSGAAQVMEVLWTHSLAPPPGAFFRRVPGTRLISYDQTPRVHLLDIETGETLRAPGFIDFVPTPDGRLFVTPGRGNSGLEFYLARDVVRLGRAGTPRANRALYIDRDMADQYPSAGILHSGQDLTRYRVLISWFRGVAFRDYDVSFTADRPPRVAPASPKMTACPGVDLSTPILSKDGRELAARDDATGTTKVFELADDGGCTSVLDLGRQTSKVAFSEDGALIAFSSPDPLVGPRSPALSSTYVFDRATSSIFRVPGSESHGLVIPEFIGADSLLMQVVGQPRRSAEFRLVCCVR